MKRALPVLVLLLALVAAYYILTYDGGAGGWPGESSEVAQGVDGGEVLRLVSWNVLNMGRSKNDREIEFMAEQVAAFDVVALQEVVTSPHGAQAVGRLAEALGRMGAQWDYRLSDPTTGRGSERYAFLWKPSRVRLDGRPFLEQSLADELDREPYLARFTLRETGEQVLVASFHAVPASKNPGAENAQLRLLHRRYPGDHLVIVGDFNQGEHRESFDALEASGFAPVLTTQRTTIRMERREGRSHLANPYDNLFVETAPLRVIEGGAIDFTHDFPTLRDARRISDHLPVYAYLDWR
jgi:endonuclease/exonuclease/phosphatase family metal-dependent hydrolase